MNCTVKEFLEKFGGFGTCIFEFYLDSHKIGEVEIENDEYDGWDFDTNLIPKEVQNKPLHHVDLNSQLNDYETVIQVYAVTKKD